MCSRTPKHSPGPLGTVTGSNLGATKELEEPAHAGNAGGKSIWFRWTATASGPWNFSTFDSGLDTTLAVYTGSSVGALTPIASNDDAGGGTNSSLSLIVVQGTIYRIAVDGYNADDANPGNAHAGPVTLHWSPISAPPTVNNFSPPSGSVGSRVTIAGSNFAGATSR